MPTEARELVLDMLQVSPCDRLTFKELCASPWVVRSGLLPQEAPGDVEVGAACRECDDDDPKLHGRGAPALPSSAELCRALPGEPARVPMLAVAMVVLGEALALCRKV